MQYIFVNGVFLWAQILQLERYIYLLKYTLFEQFIFVQIYFLANWQLFREKRGLCGLLRLNIFLVVVGCPIVTWYS